MALPPGWTYRGCFRAPDISANTDAETWNYGGGYLAFDPNDGGIFVNGIETQGRIGKIKPVATSLSANKSSLPRATTLQAPVPVLRRIPGQPFDDGRLGGLLVDGDSLYGAAYSYYNNRNAKEGLGIRVSHYKFANRNLTSTLTPLYPVGPQSQLPKNPRDVVGGYMASVPVSQRADYGYRHLTGLSGIAIVSGASSGPAVAAFDAATIGAGPFAPALPLTDYPIETPLANWGTQNNLFNGTSEIKGVMMDQAGDVHFFGSHGTGQFTYGGSGDNARGDSTTHAPPYRYQIWTYAKADLLAVKNGAKQPHQITPVVYPLTLPFSTSACYAGGMCYDQVNGLVYVAAMRCDGSLPIIHVFSVASAPVDVTGPVISNVRDAIIGQTTATISWDTDEPSDTRVEYGPTPAYGTIKVQPELVTSHVYTLTGLQPGTTYNYRVKSWDAAGNSTPSANRTFTTLSPPPPVDPCEAVKAERDALKEQVVVLQGENTTLDTHYRSVLAAYDAMTAERDAALAKIQNGLGFVNQAKAALE